MTAITTQFNVLHSTCWGFPKGGQQPPLACFLCGVTAFLSHEGKKWGNISCTASSIALRFPLISRLRRQLPPEGEALGEARRTAHLLKPPLCKGRWHGEAVTEGLIPCPALTCKMCCVAFSDSNPSVSLTADSSLYTREPKEYAKRTMCVF